MKKIFTFLLFGAGISAIAQQPVVSPSNPTINDKITITYGPDTNNNWTYLDPKGDNTLYLYLGLDTNNDVATWEYNDKWNNCDPSNLIPMNYNSSTGKFEATFDLRTHNFDGVGGILPVGITVYNGQFIIRRHDTYTTDGNPAGCLPPGTDIKTWQGENKSFNITTAVVQMSVKDVNFKDLGAKIVDGNIYFTKGGNYKVSIFDTTGRIKKTFEVKNASVNQKFSAQENKNSGFNICVIEDKEGNKQVIKFVK